MLGTRHEEYQAFTNGLPFVLNANLERSCFNRSKENNWHDNLEIQLCTEGKGIVLLDGERFEFNKGDVAIINSNVLHYTGTDTHLTYSCLIVSTDFCKQVDIDPNVLSFESIIKSSAFADKLAEINEIYLNSNIFCRKAKLNKLVLEIIIELAEHYIVQEAATTPNSPKYETVKSAISYIRDNYAKKITLDEIAKAVLCDKYALCREFKKLTGQTIFENLNNYRSIKAIDYLSEGYTVAQTASLCGFSNLSFFAKTFKKHIGKLPSEYRKLYS